jgi:integrase
MKIKGLYHMPGSKFFWYRWTVNGKRHAVSLKTTDLGEAIAKIQSAHHFHRTVKLAPPVSEIQKVVEAYLKECQSRDKKPMRPGTAYRQGNILREFLRTMNIRSPSQLDLKAFQSFLDRKRLAGRSLDTLWSNARALKSFTNYCVANGVVPPVFEKFNLPERNPAGRKNWLKLDVLNRVISSAENVDLKFILFCGGHAGLRKSEVINSKVGWFDLDAGLLHVQNDVKGGFILKDRENRTIPLTKEFLEFLRNFLSNRDRNEYAIRPTKDQGRSSYRYDFYKFFRTHMKTMNEGSSTFHDLRRSFASNLISHGVSVYKVAKWLGDGVAVVERSYGHLSPSDSDINVLS